MIARSKAQSEEYWRHKKEMEEKWVLRIANAKKKNEERINQEA